MSIELLDLPKRWKYVSLSSLGKFDSGGTPSKAESKYWGGNIPFVTGGDITKFHVSAKNARTFLTREGLESGKTAICKPGTLMVVTRTGVGRVGIAKDVMGASQDLSPFNCNDKVLPEYLCWYLLSVSDHLADNARGATIQGITREFVGSLQVPLPPLEEQKRIVEIVRKCDRIRRIRRFSQQNSDTYLRSLFLDMFGDPVANPKCWHVRKLGDLGAGKNAIVDGPFGSSIDTAVDYIPEGEIPVIRSLNIKPLEFISDNLKFISRDKYLSLQRSKVVPGDVLLVKVGINLGDTCIFPQLFDEAILSTTGSCKITPNNQTVNTKYLAVHLYLLKEEMRRIASEAAQPFLNMTTIKDLSILLPPLSQQEKFAQVVRRFERIRTQQREAERQAEHLFQTVLHRAFRGEL